MSLDEAAPRNTQQTQSLTKEQSTSFNTIEEQSSSLTDVNLSEIVQELNRPAKLDNSEVKRFTMRELSKPDLSTIENPDTFYASIKLFMDEKIDSGDTSLTTTKLMNSLNQFIDSRMSKILMTCFRHYNNDKILDEQKAFMTPQELEMANQIIQNIRTFREFIYH